jgi:uncharacterized protein
MTHVLNRRAFLKLMVASVGGVAASGAGGVAYAREVEPAWVDVTAVRLRLPRLDPAFEGYRVAQISDIHLGDWMTRDRLAEVVALTNRRAPDLVAITGDFVTNRPALFAHDLITTLRDLRAPDGVVAVMGNHDWHTPTPGDIPQVMRESNIINVDNAAHTVGRGRALLHFGGVDDVWWNKARLDQTLARLPPEGAAVLLAHEPDFADTAAASGRFDLQISGHSHGGQVVLPGLGPQRLPPLALKYPADRYQVGPMIQYTNRGVGMVRPHFRFMCRPEITLFTFTSAPA